MSLLRMSLPTACSSALISLLNRVSDVFHVFLRKQLLERNQVTSRNAKRRLIERFDEEQSTLQVPHRELIEGFQYLAQKDLACCGVF